MQGRNWIAGLGVAPFLLLGGCAASVNVTPLLKSKSTDCQFSAPVHFDGKAEYLPSVLVPSAGKPASAEVRYTFEAQYGLNEYNAFLVAANPLSLVGFPTGSDHLVVTGKVEFFRGDSVLRTYAAAASMQRTPTIFGEGETFTEMRRQGLQVVRENLSVQLCQDRSLLDGILSEPPQPDPKGT